MKNLIGLTLVVLLARETLNNSPKLGHSKSA